MSVAGDVLIPSSEGRGLAELLVRFRSLGGTYNVEKPSVRTNLRAYALLDWHGGAVGFSCLERGKQDQLAFWSDKQRRPEGDICDHLPCMTVTSVAGATTCVLAFSDGYVALSPWVLAALSVITEYFTDD